MTQVFTTILIMGIVISVSLTAIIINHIIRERKTKKLLVDFYGLAAQFKFYISKQEALGKRMIALDNNSNRLIFFTVTPDGREGYLVNLDEVSSSAVKRVYVLGKSDDKYRANMEPYVKVIALRLNYKSGSTPLVLTFYEKGTDSGYKRRALEAKANEWQSLVSNRLTTEIRVKDRRTIFEKKPLLN